ncbi:MAG: class I SAM-dependent methyltransferase [Candidatus Riflebacteria bacterium]|nr:class I SAM-dependent methyltransferase [Candidatus Riflebacteria bacterium]
MVMLLLFLGNNTSAQPQENISKREKQRKVVSLDELERNLENPVRLKDMQPDRVIDVFGVKNGEIVADIGAGTGFFTFRLANKVGPAGRVFAVEIEDQLLDFIRRKMDKNKVTNIIPIKSSDPAPNLPPAICDKIFVAGSYYYFPDSVLFMSNARKALKPGGLVAVVDLENAKYKVKPKKFALTDQIGTAAGVIDEMKKAGFTLRESHDFLKFRFFLVFSASEEASQTAPLK